MKLTPATNSNSDGTQTRSISVSLPPGEGLVLTGSVKVVDNQTPLPLSMVLEELSGSEERRGSCSSVALGSIPKISEAKSSGTHPVHVPKKNQSSTPNNGGQRDEIKRVEKSVIGVMCNETFEDKLSTISNHETQSCLNPSHQNEGLQCPQQHDFHPNNVRDQSDSVSQPVKKTVFSLLSQMDSTSSSRRKAGENPVLQKSIQERDLSNITDVRPETEEPCSPMRLLSCRLQSGDNSDIRPNNSGCPDDQERTKQLSPSKLRKVGTVCHPSMPILQSSKQSSD